MEKSSEYIDHEAYIRYLRKVTGEQVDTAEIRREIMEKICPEPMNDCES